jgi:hypothetical protein
MLPASVRHWGSATDAVVDSRHVGTTAHSKAWQCTRPLTPPAPPLPPHPRPPACQCGIVYCLARAECERVADELEGKLAEAIYPLPRGRRRVK